MGIKIQLTTINPLTSRNVKKKKALVRWLKWPKYSEIDVIRNENKKKLMHNKNPLIN